MAAEQLRKRVHIEGEVNWVLHIVLFILMIVIEYEGNVRSQKTE